MEAAIRFKANEPKLATPTKAFNETWLTLSNKGEDGKGDLVLTVDDRDFEIRSEELLKVIGFLTSKKRVR